MAEEDEVKVNPWPGGAKERKAHVEALKEERAMLEGRPESANRDRRIGEVDEQLDRFSGSPRGRTRETAGGAAKTAAAKTAASSGT